MATQFKSTEQAVAFGKHANVHQVNILKIQRDYYLRAAKAVPQDSPIEDLNKALFFGVQAQFMREALEAGQTATLN